jgi:hypothetical protein
MRTIIPKDFDFVKLGIGGLNNEFNQVLFLFLMHIICVMKQ